ncbi:MAG: hypothetical protein E6J91_29315 [Deltaproteobacteria bacterium]|nr:MAG: hypothetical protein E6J91_29315 [Deltaproteobacteria bacterium]
MPAFPWRKGHEVDRYVIIRSVGGTEDGVIYEAFDPERDDRVVVKQLDLHIDDPATPELMTLAQKLGQLSHPGLLQMLSVGVHDGFVYFVYEFIKGTTLLEAGGEDPRQIISLFADAGRGLGAAHEVGIAHGCFSATSCVVGRNGKVKVLDFGVGEARIHRVAATNTATARTRSSASSRRGIARRPGSSSRSSWPPARPRSARGCTPRRSWCWARHRRRRPISSRSARRCSTGCTAGRPTTARRSRCGCASCSRARRCGRRPCPGCRPPCRPRCCAGSSAIRPPGSTRCRRWSPSCGAATPARGRAGARSSRWPPVRRSPAPP